MAQLHALLSRIERLKKMQERGEGCAPCIERSLADVKKQIKRMEDKEAKDGS